MYQKPPMAGGKVLDAAQRLLKSTPLMVRLARFQELTKEPILLARQQKVPAPSKAKGAAIVEVIGLQVPPPGVGVRVGVLVGVAEGPVVGVLVRVGVRVGVAEGPVVGVFVRVGVRVDVGEGPFVRVGVGCWLAFQSRCSMVSLVWLTAPHVPQPDSFEPGWKGLV